MDLSIFMDKASIPTDEDLKQEFMAAFVFGGKAFEVIKNSDISPKIVSDLESAKVYAEGRGIRIPVPDRSALKDIFSLIDIKLAH